MTIFLKKKKLSVKTCFLFPLWESCHHPKYSYFASAI